MTDEPQIIRAPNGEELIVLTRVAYDRLVAAAADHDENDEDAADLAIARAAKAEWEAAGRPVASLQILRLVRAGESYLKAFRAERGLTRSQLAKKANIAQGYLGEIEPNRKTPNETIRKALANALDIHPIWLSENAPRPAREMGDA